MKKQRHSITFSFNKPVKYNPGLVTTRIQVQPAVALTCVALARHLSPLSDTSAVRSAVPSAASRPASQALSSQTPRSAPPRPLSHNCTQPTPLPFPAPPEQHQINVGHLRTYYKYTQTALVNELEYFFQKHHIHIVILKETKQTKIHDRKVSWTDNTTPRPSHYTRELKDSLPSHNSTLSRATFT